MALKLSVFGLGYVGCVSAACFARMGHAVVGVDVSESKVDLINGGKATIVEADIAGIVSDVVAAGRMRATTHVAEAIESTDVSLICVGTPSRPNGSLDLSYVDRVCAEIGSALRNKASRHTVILRSTVLPGSTHDVAIPALERSSGKRAGPGFGVGMNPEFLREGSSIRDFHDPPFTVIGCEDSATEAVARQLYAGIPGAFHVVAIRVAEMLKYSCNSFHGVKIAFANEIGNVCKVLGVDSHEVMRLFCEDTKLNISAAYLKPGFAFGGSCLPKDLRAVTYRARQSDLDTPLLSGTLASNRRQVERAFDLVMAHGKRRIGMLGLAFKSGTDDLRESPLVSLAELLIGKGMDLRIFDRDVREARIVGSNREYIEREIPHIWELMGASTAEVLEWADLILIGSGAAEFRDIGQALRPGQTVVDLVRAFAGPPAPGVQYEGICW